MIKRELYLEKIRPFINEPVIKVITGMRRTGKSAILQILRDEFIQSGISKDNIIFISFESMKYSYIENATVLYKEISEYIKNDEKYYLFLDEIQEVKEWEKAINSFLVDFNIDIYLTGSNSKLLSSELATYIAGRYIEIPVYPLSFKEHLLFKEKIGNKNIESLDRELHNYIRLGGFPVVHISNYSLDDAYKIIYDIYSSIVLRDIIHRNNIRNIDFLDRLVMFVFDNVGNIFSAKKIADYFKSQQRKVDLNTVSSYLMMLDAAFIVQKVSRYDLKGKEILQTNEKFFLGDQSLKYAVMGYKDRDIAGILENIVYLELKRRGYNVFVGKLDDKEIDFIAEKRDEKIYIQVAYRLASEETIQREFSPLLSIKDHYPKYVITMDEFFQDNIEGVKHIKLLDFLLSE
ncbi:MAG: ATP-binding protein [Fusobacteriaceae bacterium]|nr:ATP-binding protein [Fusobacteriaceae bacterium]